VAFRFGDHRLHFDPSEVGSGGFLAVDIFFDFGSVHWEFVGVDSRFCANSL
jgi:hypothetical protein